MAPQPRPSRRSPARGFTLVEALVGVLVLSLGLLAIARVQPQWREHAQLARQRSEAVRLAQQEMERVRVALDVADAERDIDPDTAGTTTAYRLVRRTDVSALPHAAAVQLSVAWSDRGGTVHSVGIDSIVARLDPTLSGAVMLSPRGTPIAGPAARSIQIPLAAKDLGNGRSVMKPASDATEAWVFDNRSGALTQRCTVAATIAPQDVGPVDLSGCTQAVGMILGGEVHVSTALPPSPSAANDTPLPLSVALELEGTAAVAPWCTAEPVVGATQQYVSYRCVVIPPVGQRSWSGRTTIVPSGWNIGTGAADWRVCRYARDLDGSGAVDANAEHPAIYQNVDRALHRQNFLVVRGNAPCPSPADGHTEARLTTEPHQP